MSEPSQRVKYLVDTRDGKCCVRCGKYLPGKAGGRHHRKMRSQARKDEVHSPANLIDICGTGTTGCHGWIHSHPKEAYEQGFLVRSTFDPEKVPITTYQHGHVLLTNDGMFRQL